MMKKLVLLLALVIFNLSTTLSQGIEKQQKNKVSAGRISPGEISVKGFSLNKDAPINLQATFARYKKLNRELVFYSWIIESGSRQVIWHSLEDCKNLYSNREGKIEYEGALDLEAGDYEIYYSAMFEHMHNNVNNIEVSELIGKLYDLLTEDDDFLSVNERKFYIEAIGDQSFFSGHNGRGYLNSVKNNAIAAFVRLKDDENKQKRFYLKEESQINIYSLGEGRGSEKYDYGWIYNLDSHEKVWPNEKTDFNHAGGGSKNHQAFQTITLPRGNYQINYVTDDSHSWERWNTLPPDDPQSWGILVWADKDDRTHIAEGRTNNKPAIELTQAKNDAYLAQGFELTKDMDLSVLCIGEYDEHVYDGGKIVDADTREVKWEFKGHKAKHAGGADKNKMINRDIHLKKGHYILYYSTDNSHAYGSWNDAPPFAPELYGISIWTKNQRDSKYITPYNAGSYQEKMVITGITAVGDHEHKTQTFTIEKSGEYRVYAIGEGDEDEMFDTGWIKNMDSGQIIWEFTYRKSTHAGGASKNRMFNGNIYLQKGTYKLYYKTDGSHAFNDWNETPPRDKENYGIQIRTLNH